MRATDPHLVGVVVSSPSVSGYPELGVLLSEVLTVTSVMNIEESFGKSLHNLVVSVTLFLSPLAVLYVNYLYSKNLVSECLTKLYRSLYVSVSSVHIPGSHTVPVVSLVFLPFSLRAYLCFRCGRK